MDSASPQGLEGIAIVGMTGRFPGARSVEQFWDNLKEGRESISRFTDEELEKHDPEFPSHRSDPGYVKARGILDDAELLDAAFFGFTPREAEVTDPQHRLFLECCWEALERAGYNPDRFSGPIGVYGGMSKNTYFLNNLYPNRDRVALVNTYQAEVGNEKDYLTTRVSYRFNLHGPSVSVHTACSTSLVAVVQACQGLLTYQCDMALAGGVSVRVPQKKGYLYQEGFITSPDGHTRTFDAKAQGTVFSNGVGVVVLKRLEDAVVHRDMIYGVIRGSAINNDGSLKVSFTAPSVDRQAEVISMAQALAGFNPETISCIEAHGTGTPLGDPIEVAALTRAFRTGTTQKQFCAIASVKSNIGHLDAAAGVVGLIKTILALHHKLLPPSLHFEKPNPELDLENSPFFVNTQLRNWKRGSTPLRAGVSSFGVGGTNAHVVVEEAPEADGSSATRPWQLLALSARTEPALQQATQNLAAHLKNNPSQNLGDVAYTLQLGRKEFEYRRIVVGSDPADAAAALESNDAKRVITQKASDPEPSIVFMFPGQGAQHVFMGRDLYETEPVFREQVDSASDILKPILNMDLRDLLYPAEADAEWAAEQLKQTVITQPALFVIEHALARLWMSWGIQPQAMIGHSVGEYVAAVLAEVFSMEEGLKLLAERARLMQSQPGGSMLAVRLPEEELQQFLGNGISLAACNAPSLCVVSGPTESIKAFGQKLADQGIGTRELHTSHAFHSKMMDPVLGPFTEKVKQVPRRAPELPFISSLTGTWITPEDATAPDYWARQLRNAVRFSPGIRELQKQDNRVFLEVGPSKTLSTLAQQHAAKNIRQSVVASLSHAQERRPDVACLLDALGRLWLAGVRIDWPRLYTCEQRRRVLLPTYPFERKRFWIDPPVRAETTGASPVPVEIGEPEAVRAASETSVGASEPVTRRDRILGALKKIMNDLSGIEFSGSDLSTSFLELGLDSLLLTQASAKMQAAFGLKITFRQLLEEVGSLNDLADYLEQKLPETVESRDQKSDVRGQKIEGSPRVERPGSEVKTQRFGPYKPIERARDSGLTAPQQKHLEDLIERFNRRTGASKKVAAAWRSVLADPRSVAGFRLLWKELVYQIVVERSAGARLWDMDGNEYVDLSMCFGANLLGYSPPFIIQAIDEQLKKGIEIGPQSPLTGKVAELIRELTGLERVTFCNTGSEAVMVAVRVARTVTGRPKIAYFTGDYHGVFDEVLGRASGRKDEHHAAPVAPGIMPESQQNVLILDYGAPESLEVLRAHAHELAAVLVEPVQSRHPYLQPGEFLQALRKVTEESGTALIFDEMVTGFRIHPGGCQAWFGVHADLATYGKILGGGMPIGVVAGTSKFMNALDGGPWTFGDASVPEADVTFFAGTFVRHPLALAAAQAMLTHLKQEGPALQEKLNRRTEALTDDLNSFFEQGRYPIRVYRFGSLMRFIYPPELTFVNLIFYHMLEKGLYIRDTAQNCFLCTAHTDEDIAFISRVIKESVRETREAGFLPELPNAIQKLPSIQQVDAAVSAVLSDRAGTTRSTSADHGDESFPLTEAQKEIWLATQMGGRAACAYNESLSVHLSGPFNREVFQEAVRQVVSRHRIVLATFSTDGERQQIRSNSVVETAFDDFSMLEDREQARRIDEMIAQDSILPFDLQTGPLLRLHLVRLAPDRHQLIWTSHHIVCDGWSAGVLLDEVARIYSARCRGNAVSLPAPVPFAEYAARQARQQSTSAYRESLAFWQGQFSPLPAALELPADYPRTASRSYSGHTVKWALEASLFAQLKRTAAQQKTTLVVLLMAALKALLYRLSGQEDLVIGLPVAGQALVNEGPLVGHCVNLLPVRSRAGGDQPFSTFLAAVRKSTLDACDHQDCTFGSIIQSLAMPRQAGRLPLVEIIFNVDRDPGAINFADLKIHLEQNPKRATNFNFFFNFQESPSGLTLFCDYNADLFKEETVRRWLGHLEILMDAIAAHPETPLSELPLLSGAERQKILVEWNRTERDYDRRALLPQLFEAQAEKSANKVGVICGSDQITYSELNRRANQLAHYLIQQGVKPDTLIGIYVERSVQMLVGLLGILKAGGAYVPLDPAFPKDRLAFMLEDSGAPVLVTQKRLVDAQGLPPHKARVVYLDAEWETIERQYDQNPAVTIKPEQLAYVIYTSGSTGQPKGVQIPHRAVVNFLDSMRREPGLEQNDTLLSVTTLSFDIAGLELYLPLTTGARLVVAGREEAVDGHRLIHLIGSQQISVMQATPATWRLLLEAGWKGNPRSKILCGGEALPGDLAELLLPRGSALWNMYGPTETTIWSTVYRVAADEKCAVVSIGRPIANTQIYILDEKLRPVPIGVAGDLYIGGDGLARGYLNRLELTAEKFVPNPFSKESGSRLYRTGDLAVYRADGAIDFLGRTDFQVKLRGYRIELGEIEAVLSRHPGVRQNVVVAREDEPGNKTLVAYIVAQNGAPGASELREYLQTKLPDYMVPSLFMVLQELPLTPNRKVDRKALPAPARQRPELEKTYTAPRDSLELQLVQLWSKVLDVRPIGLRDNFFDLGGHSMKAVRLFGELEKLIGKRLPLATLFQAPTVEQLAAVLRHENWTPAWSSLVPISPGGSQPPFYCVHGAGGNVLLYRDLALHLGSDQPFYGLQARGLDGREPFHTRIEDMAADYVREIRKIQPEGPYYLGGYCMGGNVAFEMARQLHAQGQPTALLALFDTQVRWKRYPWPVRLFHQWQRVAFHAGNLLLIGPVGQSAFLLEKIRESGRRIRKYLRAVPAVARRDEGSGKTGSLIHLQAINDRAAVEYIAKPYAGQVTIFRPRALYAGENDRQLGWRPEVARGGVKVHDLNVYPAGMLVEPFVRELAANLKPCLAAAQAAAAK